MTADHQPKHARESYVEDVVGESRLLTVIPTIDRLLLDHKTELGGDFVGYRNHVYRVANLCVALAAEGWDHVEKIAIAAVFHDLGIWTDGTFDYLQPSVRLARAHLEQSGQVEWIAEVEMMILEHHKLSAYRANPGWLVESFRRADWIDVSCGLRRFGLSEQCVAPIFSTWPDAGFHRRLLQLSLKRLRTNPWAPLPMLKL